MSQKIATEMIQGLPQKEFLFFGYAISEILTHFYSFECFFKLILLHNKLDARKLI